MRVLVVGSGGREHALVWKFAQECEVHVAPGNPGMLCECHPVQADDHAGVLWLCSQLLPDLVVIGPEGPLVAGLADLLRANNFPAFGPGAKGAKLEASKAFSKELMSAAGVPTAKSLTCTNPSFAIDEVRRMFAEGHQVVVKASGNALGKGVVVCETEDEALEAIQTMMVKRQFGEAGETVVIEERLIGREFSLLTLCNETGYHSLPVAQDYKRIFDGDQGPNTGGMGSYSPVSWVSEELIRETEELVVAPTLQFLRNQIIQFRGVLFSGLMLTSDGVKCLEYNVRFGDPETQSVVRRLGTGLADALLATATGEQIPPVPILDNHAVTVVLANAGYPGAITSNPEISIPTSLPEGVEVFQAGTKVVDGKLIATGGRVLNVSAAGATLEESKTLAYKTAELIRFEGVQFRNDIGR